MRIVIIKYNAGNIHSVRLALQRLGIDPLVSDDPEQIRAADKVIFPGVGEASSALQYLQEHYLDEIIIELKQPILGICLGLQLMCSHSQENDTPCLGIFDCPVLKFPPTHKVPHMGWNTIVDLQGPLFEGIAEGSYVYFVHSYYACANGAIIARTEYSVPFAAALYKDNFYAVQFHPEKSGSIGEQILRNFIQL